MRGENYEGKEKPAKQGKIKAGSCRTPGTLAAVFLLSAQR